MYLLNNYTKKLQIATYVLFKHYNVFLFLNRNTLILHK